MALFGTKTGKATFATAGAEPPMILRADRAFEMVEALGPLRGLFPVKAFAGGKLHDDACLLLARRE